MAEASGAGGGPAWRQRCGDKRCWKRKPLSAKTLVLALGVGRNELRDRNHKEKIS